jgi:hypothetical protein
MKTEPIYLVVDRYTFRDTFADLSDAKKKASDLSAKNHGPSHVVVEIKTLQEEPNLPYHKKTVV